MKRFFYLIILILFLLSSFFISNLFAQERSSRASLPNLPKTWTQIVPTSTEFMGRELRPTCSGGIRCKGWPLSCNPGDTTFSFFVKGGTVNNLLVYFQGGGACWDSINCLYIPTYLKEIYVNAESLKKGKGIFEVDHPENPFKDWSFVFIPYCTGDLHWGSNNKEYRDYLNWFGGENITIHHRGFDNFLVVLKWVKENFLAPDHIFVTGSSAGSFGAILGFPYIQELYLTSKVTMLGDAGIGVISEEFRTGYITHWGIESNMPTWIPGFDRPVSELTVVDMCKMIADYYPNSKLAQYTTAWDSVQILFYNIMLNSNDPTQWLQLDAVECDWHNQMIQDAFYLAETLNYRYYIGEGSDHTLLGKDKFYDEGSAGVSFVEWLKAMVDHTDALPWDNVACTDCTIPCQ